MQVTSSTQNISTAKYNSVKFTDNDTGKELSVELNDELNNKLKESNLDIRHYLEKMYSLYKEGGNIDQNEDGFLDANEFVKSKRFVEMDDKNNTYTFKSLNDILQNDSLALDVAKYMLEDDLYLKSVGATDSKIPISKDFAEFLKIDKNLDAELSQKEVLADLDNNMKIPLALTIAEYLVEQLKAWAEEEKRKVMNGISGGAFSHSMNMQDEKDVLNQLLKNDTNSLSNKQESIFSLEDSMDAISKIGQNELVNNTNLSVSEKKDIYTLTKNWKKKKKEEDGVEDLSSKNVAVLKKGFDYFDWLVSSHKTENTLDIENNNLTKIKKNLDAISKYVDTQTDNAKIFSLRI
jgi:hypothetical protein